MNANKINQLREHMNQLFLANPELIGSIKFTKLNEEHPNFELLTNPLANVGEPNGVQNLLSNRSPHDLQKLKKSYLSSDESPKEADDGGQSKQKTSSKFWEAISREMTRNPKNSKFPTIKRINNVLNIFKAKIEKVEQVYDTGNLKSTPRDAKNSHNLNDALNAKEKKLKLTDTSQYKGKEDSVEASKVQNDPEGENGVVYYSYKKKSHLKLKEMRERLAQQRPKSSNGTEVSQADVEDAMRRVGGNKSSYSESFFKTDPLSQGRIVRPLSHYNSRRPNNVASSSNDSKQTIQKRKNVKQEKGMGVVERLTKDFLNKEKKVSEEELLQGREFKFKRAKDLYLEKKQFGDTEVFQREALKKIKSCRNAFYEKITNNRAALFETVKFIKDKKTRKFNIFLPDFDRAETVKGEERDLIFASHEQMKYYDDTHNAPELEGLNKINRILEGNILLFWKHSKEMNN